MCGNCFLNIWVIILLHIQASPLNIVHCNLIHLFIMAKDITKQTWI